MVDGKLGESLAIKGNLRLGESRDERGILVSKWAESSVETNVPERTECALLQLAIAVCVLTSLDDGFLGLLHRCTLHAPIALHESLELLGPSVPMNTAFHSHGIKRKRLDMWDEVLESTLVCRMHELRAIQTLLALALLEEKVTLAVPIECKFPASCAVNTLLGAAV